MHRFTVVAVVVLGLGSSAVHAQPAVPPAPPEPPAPPPAPPPPPEPFGVDPFGVDPGAPPARPADQPPFGDAVSAAPIPAPAPAAAPAPPPPRRDRVSLGLGLGFASNRFSDGFAPNTASARIRLGRSITLEPLITATVGSATRLVGGLETDYDVSAVDVELTVRVPIQRRGRVGLSVVGGGSASRYRSTGSGSDDDTRTDRAAVVWGLGLDYALGPHWSLSMTALNPLLRRSRDRFESPEGATGFDELTYGVVFDPLINGMIHVYL